MSETESDHEYDGETDSIALIEPTQNQGPPPSFDDVVQILGDDDSAYTHSTELSRVIIEFLTSALRQRENESKQRALHAFQCLVTAKALDDLLRLRLRLLVHGSGLRKASAACINQILSKLGALVLFVVSDPNEQEDYTRRGQTLCGQMEYDSCKAAGQLPDRWHDFPSTLNLDSISPAAKRLMIRLLFGVFVVQSDVERSRVSLATRDSQAISAALESIIRESVQFNGITGAPIILRDAVDCAFCLGLYSAAESTLTQEGCQSFLPIDRDRAVNKPYLETHILALLDLVLYPADYPQQSVLVANAYAICLWWGNLVPWCWAAWVDQRLAGIEIVTTLTIRWLESIDYSLVCASERRYSLTMRHLYENTAASFIALSEVLAHGVSQLQGNNSSQPPVAHLLGQSCSFILLALQKAIECNDHHLCERIQPHISRVCRSILFLCVLGPRTVGDSETSTANKYLELLLTVDKEVLQECLKGLQTDHAAQFSSKVDQFFKKTKNYLGEFPILPWHVSVIRFALGFLTILCDAGVRGIVLRESISSFFAQLHNLLIDYGHEHRKILLGPLITTLMVAETFFAPSRPFAFLVDNENLWQLCLSQPIDNVHSNLALAQYIIQRPYPQNRLLMSETLDHFRTIMLDILRGKMPCDHRGVLQLGSSTFCLAMTRLLAGREEDSQVTKWLFASSPWTSEFCDELQQQLSARLAVFDESRNKRYDWRNAMTAAGALLLQALSENDGTSRAMQVSEVLARRHRGAVSHSDKAPDTKLVLYQAGVMAVAVA